MHQGRRLGADHQARQARDALLPRVRDTAHPARAQDRAAMAQRPDLVELVADVQDAAPRPGELAQRDEQPLDRLWRQHRGGFVEDQQPGVGEQRTHDLHPLALAHRQRVDRTQRIDLQPVFGGLVPDALDHRGQADRAIEAEQHVLGDGERVEQREVLEDHRDAQRARLVRAAHLHRHAVPADHTGIGAHGSVGDLHQRRLAGPVLAKHRVDLAGHHRQRNRIVGEHRRIALGDLVELQAGMGHRGDDSMPAAPRSER